MLVLGYVRYSLYEPLGLGKGPAGLGPSQELEIVYLSKKYSIIGGREGVLVVA